MNGPFEEHSSMFRPHVEVMRRSAFLLAGALLLWVSLAQARIVPLGPAFQVNTATQGEAQCPQVVALPDGGFVVVWDGPGGDFFRHPGFGRHFDPTGTAVGPDFELQGVLGPRAIVAGSDGIVLSWWGETDLSVGAFTADGTAGIAQIIEPALNIFNGPSLTKSPDHEFTLVWSEYANDERTIVGQRLNAGLHPDAPSFVVTSPGPGNEVPDASSIASAADGSFEVVWVNLGDVDGLWGQRFDPRTLPVGQPFAVVAPGFLDAGRGPAICNNETGGFVVAWGDTYHSTQFRRYNAQAQALTGPLDTSVDSSVSLECVPESALLVAGAIARPVDGQTVIDIAGRAFDQDNRPIGQFLIPVPDFVCGPQVATLPGNTFVAAWDQCAGGNGKGCDIFAQRFALAPGEECTGDCNGDGVVTIDELITAVNIALTAEPGICSTTICPAIDTNLDCQVSITEIEAAVNRALGGCE